MGQVSPPENLAAHHDVSEFESGEPALDEWLRGRAKTNEAAGASRTYVVCESPARVAGYYTLSVGVIAHAHAPGRIKRNMPDPVPAMVLGRLAVGKSMQGSGLGSALLRDAILRTLQAAQIAGIRAILVHAISERARDFYLNRGFVKSPLDPMTVMITLHEASRILDLTPRPAIR